MSLPQTYMHSLFLSIMSVNLCADSSAGWCTASWVWTYVFVCARVSVSCVCYARYQTVAVEKIAEHVYRNPRPYLLLGGTLLGWNCRRPRTAVACARCQGTRKRWWNFQPVKRCGCEGFSVSIAVPVASGMCGYSVGGHVASTMRVKCRYSFRCSSLQRIELLHTKRSDHEEPFSLWFCPHPCVRIGGQC